MRSKFSQKKNILFTISPITFHNLLGIVLVALNPYQNVPLYSQEIINAYSGKHVRDIEPHIFAVAENAFRSMVT